MALEPRVYTRTTTETIEGIRLTAENMVEAAGSILQSSKVRSVELGRSGTAPGGGSIIELEVRMSVGRIEKFRRGDFIAFSDDGGIRRVYSNSTTTPWVEA